MVFDFHAPSEKLISQIFLVLLRDNSQQRIEMVNFELRKLKGTVYHREQCARTHFFPVYF